MKSFIINTSKEYTIVSQFTSFVAIEKRDKVNSYIRYYVSAALVYREDISFNFSSFVSCFRIIRFVLILCFS